MSKLPGISELWKASIDLVEDVAKTCLATVHGKKSADYVLGYQRCAKDIIEACEKAREL
jgi:hypothetical protein